MTTGRINQDLPVEPGKLWQKDLEARPFQRLDEVAPAGWLGGQRWEEKPPKLDGSEGWKGGPGKVGACGEVAHERLAGPPWRERRRLSEG